MPTNNLTIIVKDSHNALVKNAQVTINPSGVTGKTDEKGQVNLPLPDQKKVTVTVKLNDITQEVPFYINGQQGTRLEVNLSYFQKIKSQEIKETPKTTHSPLKPSSVFGIIILVIALILIALTLKKKLFRA